MGQRTEIEWADSTVNCTTVRRVAVWDREYPGWSIALYWVNNDDEIIHEIPWPEDWPESCTWDWVQSQGYECIVA